LRWTASGTGTPFGGCDVSVTVAGPSPKLVAGKLMVPDAPEAIRPNVTACIGPRMTVWVRLVGLELGPGLAVGGGDALAVCVGVALAVGIAVATCVAAGVGLAITGCGAAGPDPVPLQAASKEISATYASPRDRFVIVVTSGVGADVPDGPGLGVAGEKGTIGE